MWRVQSSLPSSFAFFYPVENKHTLSPRRFESNSPFLIIIIYPWIQFTLSRHSSHYPRHRIAQGFSCSVVRVAQLLILWIRVVRQDLTCVDSDDLDSSCLFGCVFTSILAVTLFIPSCVVHLPKRHMMCSHFESFTGFLCIIVISWHFSPGSRHFLFDCNKIIIIRISCFSLLNLFWKVVNRRRWATGSRLLLKWKPLSACGWKKSTQMQLYLPLGYQEGSQLDGWSIRWLS